MEFCVYLKNKRCKYFYNPFCQQKVVEGSMNLLTQNTVEKETWIKDKKALMFTVTLLLHKPKYKRRI